MVTVLVYAKLIAPPELACFVPLVHSNEESVTEIEEIENVSIEPPVCELVSGVQQQSVNVHPLTVNCIVSPLA